MTALEAGADPQASDRPTDKRLRRAALLIAPGLAIQALTLSSAHPLAFIVFMFPGGFLVAAGIVMFLWAIASA
ncbi:MAG: hypothetical protein ABJC13_08720 [Acidobacteriota bacterium]